MYSSLHPVHFTPPHLWAWSKSSLNDAKPQDVFLIWWRIWSEAGWKKVPTSYSHVFQEPEFRSLTPPTSSKWPSPLAMSCPLKAQEKETSRTGSLATWHGNTMLSPTMISMSTGPWVILVGSMVIKYPAPQFQKDYRCLNEQPYVRRYKLLATVCTDSNGERVSVRTTSNSPYIVKMHAFFFTVFGVTS